MGHGIITGITGSGKSTFGKRLAASFRKMGRDVIVLDPISTSGWNATFQTRNKREFLEVVQKSRRCALFIDEGGDVAGQYHVEMHWLATKSRHIGHQAYFIVQRPQMIATTIRNNCELHVSFRISLNDAEVLARESGKVELLEAAKLDRGEYISIASFGTPMRGRVF